MMRAICCKAPIVFLLVVAFFILTVSFVRSPYEFQFVQQSNDTCLAFTLAAVCNMLSEIGVSSTAGILGSSFSPLTSIGISLSVQQQLFVLLRGSLKRAESLKLKRLVTSNHLAKAKFDLTVRIGVAILCEFSLCKHFILCMSSPEFGSLCVLLVFIMSSLKMKYYAWYCCNLLHIVLVL